MARLLVKVTVVLRHVGDLVPGAIAEGDLCRL
jgi:hypothetical protein